MELALIVWAISILGSVTTFLFFLGIGLLIAALIQTAVAIENHAKEFPKKSIIGYCVAGILSFFIMSILPTEKQGYTIAAAYAGQQIAENKRVQDIGGKVVTLLEKKLDEAIKEKK